MDVSKLRTERTARTWWRLVAGILFVFATTLGLAFYLPLQKSHALLKAELAAAQNRTAALSDSLQNTEGSLQSVSAERKQLEEFKAQIDGDRQRFPKLAERFDEECNPRLREAFEKDRVQASPLVDGVAVSWMNPALLNWKRTAATRLGQSLLCPSVSRAKQLGLSKVVVRTFASHDAWSSDVGEAHTKASELSIALAEFLVRFCKTEPQDVTVASSLGDDKSPLVRFEFRGASTSQAEGHE